MDTLWDCLEFGAIVIDQTSKVVLCNRWVRDHSRLAVDPLGKTLAHSFGASLNTRLTVGIEQALHRGHSSRLSSALHPSPLPLFVDGDDNTRMRHAVDIISVARGERRECLLQIRDMTESYRREDFLRRQAQQLQDSEQRLTATLDNAPIGMALSASDGRWTYVNRALCELLGRPASDLLAGISGVHVHPEDRERHAGFDRAMATDDDFNIQLEERWLHQDGSAVWVRMTATRFSDAASGKPYIIQQIEAIDDRKRREAEVAAALAEKETLLREIYHRVKNNLQVIQSLLSLKRNSLTDVLARQALAETGERVRSMALVHEKLYQSSQLTAIDLSDYLNDLVGQLQDALNDRVCAVNVLVDADAVQADLNTAIPFGLIVTELVCNGFKHAFPGDAVGTVSIGLKRMGAGARLSVSDDGIGLAADTNLASATSLGLTLVRSLARQIDGRLTVVPGKGARFELDLPRLTGRDTTSSALGSSRATSPHPLGPRPVRAEMAALPKRLPALTRTGAAPGGLHTPI